MACLPSLTRISADLGATYRGPPKIVFRLHFGLLQTGYAPTGQFPFRPLSGVQRENEAEHGGSAMSRPGRSALQVLATTVVFFALIAPASFAQVVSISGETFETTPALGGQTTYGPYTCDKDGITVVPFESQGTAHGPYVGTFVETGTFTIGPQTNTTIDSRGVGAILAFTASFTINSQFPAGTVTGTKQLAPTSPPLADFSAFGRCDPDGSSPPDTNLFAIVSNPFLLYTAQINAVTGTRSDAGTSGFTTQSILGPSETATFQEAFTSTEPECEDGNNGNGQGSGHPKKGRDNDDDEVCS